MTQPLPRIEELVRRAADLPREERAAFLERECSKPGLRARVAEHLRRLEAAGTFVEPLAESDGASLEAPGTVIGRYKLLQHLGDGGFGSVYEAEQSEPVVRRVALKVIKLGMDTKQVVARFEVERQALALMDHPGIAKVLDGGSTASGRPFFVMELVRGIAITEYCERNRLPLRARLELFIEVCAAVQHAHQKGIIHRDLKPSNVLVALHDGRPVPKVIDFGIAKAMHARLTERTLLTEARQFIGTPVYMSPEQAERSGLDLDTRTDVYSLGVLLYELLTGSTPIDTRVLLEADFDELQRLIREQEPVRPSLRVGAAPPHDARPRGLDARALRGDLDWITLKALEKDRARRYESAAALGADVRRHLDDQPVLAGPPSASYRAAKFLRRHHLAVGAGLAVALALVAGVIGTGYGLARALRERERAEAQAADAERARDESEAVTGFLTDMIESVDPEDAGRNVTVLAVLDRASLRLDALMAERPLVEARLRQSIGLAYLALGRLAEAEENLEASLDIRRRTLGARNTDTLRASVNLAALRIEQGRDGEAETLLRVAAEGIEKEVGPDHLMTLGALSNLAVVHARRSADEEALALHRRVLEGQRRVLGPTHENTLGAMLNLSDLLVEMGRLDEAEALAREAAEGFEREHGAEKPATLLALSNLAMLESQLGRAAEAESLLERVLAARGRVLGERHAETLGSLANLGIIRARRGDVAGAEEALTRAWEALHTVLGDGHPTTVTVAGQLVGVFETQGWPARSQETLANLFASFRVAAERTDLPANTLNDLAWNLAVVAPDELRDPETALALAMRACDLERAGGGPKLWMYLDTLAAAQHATGEHSAAVATQREALSLLPVHGEPERAAMEERLHTYEVAADA